MERVMASHISGTLVPLLKEAGALWLWFWSSINKVNITNWVQNMEIIITRKKEEISLFLISN
jgi:hypothetical protein